MSDLKTKKLNNEEVSKAIGGSLKDVACSVADFITGQDITGITKAVDEELKNAMEKVAKNAAADKKGNSLTDLNGNPCEEVNTDDDAGFKKLTGNLYTGDMKSMFK